MSCSLSCSIAEISCPLHPNGGHYTLSHLYFYIICTFMTQPRRPALNWGRHEVARPKASTRYLPRSGFDGVARRYICCMLNVSLPNRVTFSLASNRCILVVGKNERSGIVLNRTSSLVDKTMYKVLAPLDKHGVG